MRMLALLPRAEVMVQGAGWLPEEHRKMVEDLAMVFTEAICRMHGVGAGATPDATPSRS